MEPSFPVSPQTLALYCRKNITPTQRLSYIPTLRACIDEFCKNTAIPFYNCIESLMLGKEALLKNEASSASPERENALIIKAICLELMKGLRELQTLAQQETPHHLNEAAV